jgi:hypothetical protein
MGNGFCSPCDPEASYKVMLHDDINKEAIELYKTPKYCYSWNFTNYRAQEFVRDLQTSSKIQLSSLIDTIYQGQLKPSERRFRLWLYHPGRGSAIFSQVVHWLSEDITGQAKAYRESRIKRFS